MLGLVVVVARVDLVVLAVVAPDRLRHGHVVRAVGSSVRTVG